MFSLNYFDASSDVGNILQYCDENRDPSVNIPVLQSFKYDCRQMCIELNYRIDSCRFDDLKKNNNPYHNKIASQLRERNKSETAECKKSFLQKVLFDIETYIIKTIDNQIARSKKNQRNSRKLLPAHSSSLSPINFLCRGEVIDYVFNQLSLEGIINQLTEKQRDYHCSYIDKPPDAYVQTPGDFIIWNKTEILLSYFISKLVKVKWIPQYNYWVRTGVHFHTKEGMIFKSLSQSVKAYNNIKDQEIIDKIFEEAIKLHKNLP